MNSARIQNSQAELATLWDSLSMSGEQVQSLARELLDQYGLSDWSFGFNHGKRTLGLCKYHQKRIELSKHLIASNGLAEVRETLLHEIAHALAGRRAGHGAKWKRICERIGARPQRCDDQATMPTGRWQAVCGGCGTKFSRHRRPRRNAKYSCRNCGPQRGALVFAVRVEG